MDKKQYGIVIMQALTGMESRLNVIGSEKDRTELFDYIFDLHKRNIAVEIAIELTINHFGFTQPYEQN